MNSRESIKEVIKKLNEEYDSLLELRRIATAGHTIGGDLVYSPALATNLEEAMTKIMQARADFIYEYMKVVEPEMYEKADRDEFPTVWYEEKLGHEEIHVGCWTDEGINSKYFTVIL